MCMSRVREARTHHQKERKRVKIHYFEDGEAPDCNKNMSEVRGEWREGENGNTLKLALYALRATWFLALKLKSLISHYTNYWKNPY